MSEAQTHVAGMSVAERVAYYKAVGDRERAAQAAAQQDTPGDQGVRKSA
jgi:hypothetical protein